jgi:Uma2 family endonuclease
MSTDALPTMTVAQYLAFERASPLRHEFYRGELFAMSGVSISHGRIVMNLGSELRVALRNSPCEVLGPDSRVRVSSTGLYTYPDLLVACEPLEFDDDQRDTLLNPRVIVEVLSRSTEAYDRGTKFAHYRSLPSLREYVLVSQDQPLVERYTRRPEESWELREFRGLETQFDLTAIPFRAPLSVLYERVEFPPVVEEPGRLPRIVPPPEGR